MVSPARLRMPLRPFVQVLGKVVDLVGVDDHAHGHRVAYFATQLAEALALPEDHRERLYEAALVHDCGVSSTREHRMVMGEIDWAKAQHHCRLGHQRLVQFAPLASLAEIVMHHHSPWTLLRSLDVSATIALDANLVFLADRIDAVSFPYQRSDLLGHAASIRETLARIGDDAFAPELVRAFLDVSRAEAFWIPLAMPEALFDFHAARAHETRDRALDWASFKKGSRLLADIVDAKSPFTHAHSLGVAALARLLAELAGMDAEDVEQVEMAGLLHDLGKLHIADEILEAPRPLDEAEWREMRTHSFLTLELLKPLHQIKSLARWAAGHHERLNGQGYPFRIRNSALPLPMRVLAVADVYQALAQDRPYRAALAPQEVMQVLLSMANENALDRTIVALVRTNLERCHAVALAPDRRNIEAHAL